ncbi:RNA polymerase sigma factor [Mucilaginibacter sp.]|uniref:RNA polymerase sigma factor n=1 Tax=Mucilaginibacter sp. TaxID=1882438 RepID=UPI000CACDD08|nr:hypothetical protein [Mucilaginibacter sp.]PLW90973.1 MAG: hypothetical protein C0154_03625 [Mucilaginibacter sp.]PMP66322.1 MAG: hypothetical protein C0191_00585 [Mucilaginibacter sp.]HEK21336.1 hypothetical protein [Bacteroidota bacterium]
MDTTDDREILAGLLNVATRPQAFRVLLQKYLRKIYFLMRAMNLAHEVADEYVQDIFTGFWKKLNTLKPEDQLDLLLFRLAVERSLSFLKQHPEAALYDLSAEQQIILILKQQGLFDSAELATVAALPVAQVRADLGVAIVKVLKGGAIINRS